MEHWPEWVKYSAQLRFICSKSAIETIEKGMEYVQN